MTVRVLSKGEQTRERILEIAEHAVLHKGFAGTSLDEIICEAGITKSGFFYHFGDKNALAHEMLLRYVAANDDLFEQLFGRGAELSDDPLQGFERGGVDRFATAGRSDGTGEFVQRFEKVGWTGIEAFGQHVQRGGYDPKASTRRCKSDRHIESPQRRDSGVG